MYFTLQNNWWRWREDVRYFQIGDVSFDTRTREKWASQRSIRGASTWPRDAVPWISRPEEAVAVYASSATLCRRRSPKSTRAVDSTPQPGTTGSHRRRWRRRTRGYRILRFLSDWCRETDNVLLLDQLTAFTSKGLIPHISYQCSCCLFGFTNTKRLLQVCKDVLKYGERRKKSASSFETPKQIWTQLFHMELLVIRLPTWILYVYILDIVYLDSLCHDKNLDLFMNTSWNIGM